ncbi:response regulator [Anaerolineae bacterium CFX9]|jgi:CheY-like chemotaxis protein|nr:response regulator [Anaerolineae bacterium CFX9]
MPKVLVVDDDRVTVKLLTTLLELDGFDVVVASNGEEVLPIARHERPDLILMDYHLMDMDGVDCIRQLRALPDFAAIPIVMASGLDVEKEAMAAGASRFIGKPYEPNDLPVIFNELLG